MRWRVFLLGLAIGLGLVVLTSRPTPAGAAYEMVCYETASLSIYVIGDTCSQYVEIDQSAYRTTGYDPYAYRSSYDTQRSTYPRYSSYDSYQSPYRSDYRLPIEYSAYRPIISSPYSYTNYMSPSYLSPYSGYSGFNTGFGGGYGGFTGCTCPLADPVLTGTSFGSPLAAPYMPWSPWLTSGLY